MRFAYVVHQVPTAGAAAFMPTLTRPGLIATRGLTHVVGHPGTVEVPSPPPGLPDMSFDEHTAPSAVSPDAILPTEYVALPDNMGPWSPNGAMHTRESDQTLPVPTTQINYQATPVTRRARIGGNTVWPNPRNIMRYRSGNGVPSR